MALALKRIERRCVRMDPSKKSLSELMTTFEKGSLAKGITEKFMILYIIREEQHKYERDVGMTDFVYSSAGEIYNLVKQTFETDIQIQTIYSHLSYLQKHQLVNCETGFYGSGLRIRTYCLNSSGDDVLDKIHTCSETKERFLN